MIKCTDNPTLESSSSEDSEEDSKGQQLGKHFLDKLGSEYRISLGNLQFDLQYDGAKSRVVQVREPIIEMQREAAKTYIVKHERGQKQILNPLADIDDALEQDGPMVDGTEDEQEQRSYEQVVEPAEDASGKWRRSSRASANFSELAVDATPTAGRFTRRTSIAGNPTPTMEQESY